jgi:hypothetical protein
MTTELKSIYISLDNENVVDCNQDMSTVLFQSSENYSILMGALNKYLLAVKQNLDPELNQEESVLLLASLIEKMADSLPSYLSDEPKEKVNFFQKLGEKIFQIRCLFKWQLAK